jgi:hypothetical protein
MPLGTVGFWCCLLQMIVEAEELEPGPLYLVSCPVLEPA